MKFFYVTFIYFLINTSIVGQVDKEKITRGFDKIIYYPDSTIKSAFQKKKFKSESKYDGFSIEFNESGQPIGIGQYLKGKRQGWWIKPDNSSDYYEQGITGDIVPVCGTGHWRGYDFQREYAKLLNNTTKKQTSK